MSSTWSCRRRPELLLDWSPSEKVLLVLLVGVFGVEMDDGPQLESEHLDHLQYSTAVPCLCLPLCRFLNPWRRPNVVLLSGWDQDFQSGFQGLL